MNKLLIFPGIGLGILTLAFTASYKPQKLQIKPEASKVEWRAEKVTGTHNGTVALKGGTIELDRGQLTGGEFTVAMTTIVCDDLSGEYKTKLEDHLKSEDFFSVEKHETATFRINDVKMVDEGEFNTLITGDLTIKDIRNKVTFPAKVDVRDDKFAAYGEMVIDRTKFNVRYGSASFFDNLGDKTIYDEFTLKISIGAKM